MRATGLCLGIRTERDERLTVGSGKQSQCAVCGEREPRRRVRFAVREQCRLAKDVVVKPEDY
jgi:hypothetical protein